MDSVLGLTENDILGAKITGGFTDYVKFIVRKYYSNGVKINRYIILMYYYDR